MSWESILLDRIIQVNSIKDNYTIGVDQLGCEPFAEPNGDWTKQSES